MTTKTQLVLLQVEPMVLAKQRKPRKKRIAKAVQQRKRKRYNLHYQLRKKGVVINAKQKAIYVATTATTLPLQAQKLVDHFNYQVQYIIS